MAYHPDPRFGQAPYGYQPQFTSQPNLQQHNYGASYPVGPAPPQSYIQTRPPQFPPQAHQMPQGANVAPRIPQAFAGPYSSAAPFQHNSQFDHSYSDLNQAPLGLQISHPSYQHQPFQSQIPTPTGSIPPASRPLLIPPPPPATGSSLHNLGGNVPSSWQPGHILPPKPPPNGLNEPVQLSVAHSQHQNQARLNYHDTNGGAKEATGPPQFGGPTGPPGVDQPLAVAQISHNSIISPVERLDRDGKEIPHSLIDNTNITRRSFGNTGQRKEERPVTPRQNNSVSPDIYSPQSNTGGIPGLESIEHQIDNSKQSQSETIPQKPPFAQFNPKAQSEIMPMENEPISSENESPTLNGQKQASTPANPFVLKQAALTAVKDLHRRQMSFLDIASEGVDPGVLRSLFFELGLNMEPTRSQGTNSSVSEERLIITEGRDEMQLQKHDEVSVHAPTSSNTQHVETRAKEATTAVASSQPLKPPTREEYLARLKAAKGDKAPASAEAGPNVGSSSNANAAKNKDPSPRPEGLASKNTDDALSKKADAKSIMTDRVRQKLEALKKSTREKQATQAQEAARAAQAGESAARGTPGDKQGTVKLTGEYTPTNPFFSPDNISAGIPGLSMSEESDLNREEGIVPFHLGEAIEQVQEIDIRPSDTENLRKRSRQASSQDDVEIEHNKKKATNDQHPLVIELSDEEEEGEVADSNMQSAAQRNQSTSLNESISGRPTSQSQQQYRPRDLAAREEEIRLYRQRIAALEAKKKAKKAAASAIVTPNSSTTPVQTGPLSSLPLAQAEADRALSLTRVGDQVQAQQESLVAAKSAVQERLEREVEAFQSSFNAPDPASSIDRSMRQKRMDVLHQSLATLDQQISQAEAELTKLRRQEEEVRQELQRGLRGRESFAQELKELIDSMANEDVEKLAASRDEMTDTAENKQVETNSTREAASPILDTNEAQVQSSNEVDNNSTDGDDTTMDISDVEEGEVSEDDADEPSKSVTRHSTRSQSAADLHEPLNESSADRMAFGERSDDEETPMDVEEEYEPHSDKESSEDEGMDYEPDYEPEPDPNDLGSDQSEADVHEATRDADISQETANSHDSHESEESDDGFSADFEAELASKAVSDRGREDAFDAATASTPADSSDDEVEEGSEDGGVSEVQTHNNLLQPVDNATTSNTLPGLESEDEESERSEDGSGNVSAEQASGSAGFVPYESPLRMFKAYRYHPDYMKNVSGGFSSITFSHSIDPGRQFCHQELQGRNCDDATCAYQHFRDLKLSDDRIILELGSIPSGQTPEQRLAYISGMRSTLQDLRSRGLESNINAVARELVAYRAKYLGDLSHMIFSSYECDV